MFSSDGCSFWRTEGFFFSIDVLYGGLGKGKLQFCNFEKKMFSFPALNYWIRIGLQPKILDLDPDQMNT